MKNQYVLKEICIIRLVLILLLIIYHSFAPYSGDWNAITNNISSSYHPPLQNFWIAKLSYSFFLEAFTFVSGWIFGFQSIKYPMPASNIILKKFRRLIIPSIIFSIIYILLFKPHYLESKWVFISNTLSGAGHMWYLPMLFWCFIGILIILKSRTKPLFNLIILFILSVLSVFYIPFGIGKSLYYMIFFYIGYLNGIEILNIQKFINWKTVIASAFLFISFFVILNLFIIDPIQTYLNTDATQSIITKVTLRSIRNLCNIVYSLLGLSFITIFSIVLIRDAYLKLNLFWIKVSTYTFGIYIYQQFILVYLYYHTNLFHNISHTLIPWLAAIITLILSASLTFLSKKTKIGRMLF